MGTKSWSSVVKSFYPAVESRFRFLIDEFGFAGPRRDDHMLPSVEYMTAGFGYEVSLEPRESKVLTSAWIAYEERYLRAGLGFLVEVSGLAPNQKVFRTAQSVYGMKKSLASQAHWTRIIHPLLIESSSGVDLIRLAAQKGGAACP